MQQRLHKQQLQRRCFMLFLLSKRLLQCSSKGRSCITHHYRNAVNIVKSILKMKKILMAVAMMIAMSSYAQVSKAKLVASGLTCSMCSKAIYEALQKVNTIESVKANIKESSYDIAFKKDAAVNFDAIRKAVEDAGFSV